MTTRRELRIQGLGGQGIITAARLIGEAVTLRDHMEAVMTEEYSPYVTGGWSRGDIVVSDEAIDFPIVSKPDILVAMSQEGLDENLSATSNEATIITEAGITHPRYGTSRKFLTIPAFAMAEQLGGKIMANIIILGFLTASTNIVKRGSLESAIRDRYPRSADANMKAFDRGYEFLSSGST